MLKKKQERLIFTSLLEDCQKTGGMRFNGKTKYYLVSKYVQDFD